MRPSHVVVLSVHGGERAGGVGWRAVVVVVELVVVMVFVVVVLLGMVVLVVVVVVLWVCPQHLLALRWDLGVWWIVGLGLGLGVTLTVVEGSHVRGLVSAAAVVVCGGGWRGAWRSGCG